MNLPVRSRKAGIAPGRIAPLDQFKFPGAIPFLELPLAKDRSFSCFVDLEPDEGLNSICFGEPGN